MALLSTLVDTFNTAGAINGTLWSFSNLGLNGSASYAGGHLVLNSGTTTAYNGECHVTSVSSYDMTGSAAYVNFAARSDAIRTWVGFRIETSADATDYIEMYLDETGIMYILAVNNGGNVEGTTFTFNATNHAWWRMRESGGTIYWETAPISASNPPSSGDWTVQHTASLSAFGWSGSLTSVKAHLYSRLVAAGASSAPTVEFDGFNTSSGTGVTNVNATFAITEQQVKDAFNATVNTNATRSATFAASESTNKDTFAAYVYHPGNAINVTFTVSEGSAGGGISDRFTATVGGGLVGLPPYSPAITDTQFREWLRMQSSVKCLLVEVDVNDNGTEKTLYMSNIGYVSGPTDTPANQLYATDIIGGCTIEQEVSLDYTTSMSMGDVEVTNMDGIHDAWLNYIWCNRNIRFYLGDARWHRQDFRLVFSGTVHDIASRDYNKLNIVLSDLLQRLNQSVTSTTLGGSTPNADKLIPLCFGECSNVTPLLVNPATLTYQVHNGAIQDITEVRDEGVPVNFTKDLANGKFTLDQTPAGRVTCTVQGDKFGGVYTNTLPGIIKRLVMNYGTQPFSSTEIDLTNFDNYSNLSALGIYLSDRQNILDVCNVLCSSLSSALTVGLNNKLRLIQLTLLPPNGNADTVVNESNVYAKTFEIVERLDVKPSIKLAYNRNWTPQPDLQTGIPADHKAMWADEWMTATAINSVIAAKYKVPSQPPDQTECYFITSYDAQSQLTLRTGLWSTQRTIYAYQGFGELLLDELGNWQNITHRRFGFSSGKNAFTLGVERDYLNCKVKIKALV